MSHRWASIRPSLSSSTVSASGSSRRPQITTREPSDASSSAAARPSPDPPPLTMATCPSRSPGWKIFDGIAPPAYPAGRSAEVLAVEAERDVMRRVRARHFLECPGVEHEEEGVAGVRVEHHRQHHAVVLAVRARLADEHRLAGEAAVGAPL